MQIVPGATQSICDVAETSARGDQRAALAMMLAAYFEMASRIVTSEQASSQWLLAMSAYCEAGAQRLGSAAKFYARGSRASADEEQRYYLGRLANAAHEGASFADVLRRQFESLGLVEYDRDGDGDYVDDNLDENLDASGVDSRGDSGGGSRVDSDVGSRGDSDVDRRGDSGVDRRGDAPSNTTTSARDER